MPSYRAPVEDFTFVFEDFLKVYDNKDLPGFDMLDPETVDAVLTGAGKVAEEVWAPANLPGDAEGCVLENGVVRTPSVYKDAYKAWAEGGWSSVGADPQWGGMGMPGIISSAVTEIGVSSNHALSMYFGLTGAAYSAIAGIAPQEMKEMYVPKMVSGEWCGTMNLTEPHCGTDLKLMRTKAEPQDDGTYRLTGTKIFISGGDHDLADNIIHMVIAKVPGEDGKLANDLSTVNFFLVPKFLVNPDGSLGERNGVSVGSIEKKMGIKGSATCVLNFENAVAWKLGGEPKVKKDADGKERKSSSAGMAGMFQMMNMARVGVGMQGMALASVAYQNAVEYTKERIQGRSLTGKKFPDQAADPIIVHPDVRRMLMTCKSFVEAGRAFTMYLNMEFAKARAGREDAKGDLGMLLTPVLKAYFTDMGFECTNMAMQCFGGHGFVHDNGMEQFVRDSRILPIYEGANGVQALDLVGRKLLGDGGKAYNDYVDLIESFLAENKDDAGVAIMAPALQRGLDDLKTATQWLFDNLAQNPENAGGVSASYLRIFGVVTLGFMWAGMAKSAQEALDSGDGRQSDDFYKAKLVCARFWAEQMMPETASHLMKMQGGAEVMMELTADQF
ncbi:MAG: acyl-CoA dehydrogenase C-terminal domain-containing protein [Alphaproteobacteria bacterium]